MQHEWEDRLEQSIQLLKQCKEKWTFNDALLVKTFEEKLNTLREGTTGAQEKAINVMCKKIGARLLAPSRCSQLTEEEEEVRAELSWQQMDERVFIAGCADAAELNSWVADPASFIADRAKTWLIFSDQVPIWIKIGMLKILYSAAELAERGVKAQAAAKALRRKFNASHGKDPQYVEPARAEEPEQEEVAPQDKGQKRKSSTPSYIETASEVDDKGPKRRGPGKKKAQAKKLGKKEGMSQGRGADSSGEKCRVTMEFRQGVSGYFANGKEEVKGHRLPSVLAYMMSIISNNRWSS